MHPSQKYLILSKYFSETIYPYLIKCRYWHRELLHFNFKRRDTSQERATSFLITANLHPAPWCCSSGLSGSFTGTRRAPRRKWPQRLSASRSPPSFFQTCVTDGKIAKPEEVQKFKVARQITTFFMEPRPSTKQPAMIPAMRGRPLRILWKYFQPPASHVYLVRSILLTPIRTDRRPSEPPSRLP